MTEVMGWAAAVLPCLFILGTAESIHRQQQGHPPLLTQGRRFVGVCWRHPHRDVGDLWRQAGR